MCEKTSRTGVLFVHGIQGGPHQFHFLTEYLPDHVPYRNLLLPGHGKTVKEFRKSSHAQWLSAVESATRELYETCDRILYVGHSMGGLLGLLADQTAQKPYAGMLLMACPLKLGKIAAYLRSTSTASITKGNTDDPFIKALWESNSVSSSHLLGYLTCVRPYVGLLKLIHRTNRLEPKRQLPVDFVFSGADEIVSLKSAKNAQTYPRSRITVLDGCGHAYYTQEALQFIRSRLLEMLEL